jgi:hypothetical protein
MIRLLASILAEAIYWTFFILVFISLAFLDIWLIIKLINYLTKNWKE